MEKGEDKCVFSPKPSGREELKWGEYAGRMQTSGVDMMHTIQLKQGWDVQPVLSNANS